MTITHLMNRSLAVWRRDFTADGAGGRSGTFEQVGTVRARVSQPSANEQTLAQQAHAELAHSIYLLPGADVARGDQLRGNGQTFEVHHTVTPSRAVYLRADCELMQAESAVT